MAVRNQPGDARRTSMPRAQAAAVCAALGLFSALAAADAAPAPAPVPAGKNFAPASTKAKDPPKPKDPQKAQDAAAKPALDIPAASRLLTEGETLIVAPGQNLTVENPAMPERRLPVLDSVTGAVRWVTLPARDKQVVAIRWLDTSNIKKLVEIEMLEGDLYIAANPRDQTDLSLAVRGRKTGMVFDAPGGWTAIDHRVLKVHLEVDASLRVVGYGHALLPAGGDDATRDLGMHLFASLRPGATVQNAGETTLVVEQYDTRALGRFSDRPTRVILPPETSLSTNGGNFDLRHFYVPEPGQPGGPARTIHVGANPPEAARQNAGIGEGEPRAADAPAGAHP